MTDSFRVGLTRDFLNERGEIGWGEIGLSMLDEAGIAWEFLPELTRELTREQVDVYDAVVVLMPRVSAATVEGTERLAIVARFGVGYDSVDVGACTRAGVLVSITPDGVRRPMASTALTLMLALTHRLPQKDRITREGRWNDRLDYMGMGLRGRTLGTVGLGNIARDFLALAAPHEMRHVASDPFVSDDDAAALGVELLPLESMLEQADVVVVTASLSPATHHLLNAERLTLMKPTAFLVNIARGPIVDQAALTEVLRERRIAGAGLDVFEEEPVDPSEPLLGFDNVIVAPHALGWTDEMALGNGRSALGSILDVAAGRVPTHLVDPAAAESDAYKAKLSRRKEVAQ